MSLRSFAFAAMAFAVIATASAQTLQQPTSFVYQGTLLDDGSAVTGEARLTITLWDAQVNGSQISMIENRPDVDVVDGQFAVDIDFGSLAFNGTDAWLQIEIVQIDGGFVDVILPRQRISATPMALQTRGLFVDNTGGMNLIGPDEGFQGGLRLDDSASALISLSLTLQDPGGNPDIDDIFRITRDTNDDVTLRFLQPGGDTAFYVDKQGFVGIGTDAPEDELHVSGTIRSGAVRLVNGADIAERFNVNSEIEPVPGMVVSIDPAQPGALRVADEAYDHSVAGVLSGAGGINAGLVLGQEGTIADGRHHVALTGRVWCLVDADANGPITPGSLLTTSPTLGHAMRASDRDLSFGATIGKAMTPLESGKGLVLVLVNLH